MLMSLLSLRDTQYWHLSLRLCISRFPSYIALSLNCSHSCLPFTSAKEKLCRVLSVGTVIENRFQFTARTNKEPLGAANPMYGTANTDVSAI